MIYLDIIMPIVSKLSHKALSFIIVMLIFVGITIDIHAGEWAQVRIPVACIREDKGHSTELISQAIMGTPLKILDSYEEWLHVKGPDNYEGYMNVSSVSIKSDEDMVRWRKSDRFVSISRSEVKIYGSLDARSPYNIVSEVVLSSIIEGKNINDSILSLTLPDGRIGFADARYFIPIEEWASKPMNIDHTIETAYWLSGTPYLWGACSTKSVDCSGLVRVVYFDQGILTLRDARQQIEIGKRIAPGNLAELQRGDLLFFSNSPEGRISHVAIYDQDGRYIHSSGLVKTNRMSADDPDFSKRYYRGASRIIGMENTPGITKMINHNWYFDK